MPIWTVCGGEKLNGRIKVQGAKNAVLPIMAASLLGGGVSRLEGCPGLSDVAASVDILRYLGCDAASDGDSLIIDSTPMNRCHIRVVGAQNRPIEELIAEAAQQAAELIRGGM